MSPPEMNMVVPTGLGLGGISLLPEGHPYGIVDSAIATSMAIPTGLLIQALQHHWQPYRDC